MKALVVSTTLFTASIVRTSALVPHKLRINKSPFSLSSIRMMSHDNSDTKQVAIIGAGAAGLATARAFLTNSSSNIKFDVSVFESRTRTGGIWDYESTINGSEKRRPMYKNLKTNLPKELMAFREYPWTGTDDSYVTHGEVKKYLDGYCAEFGLNACIRYGCTVEQLTLLDNKEEWAQMGLRWRDDGKVQEQTFDIVCVCNGHYALPSFPKLDGIDSFQGKVIHAIQYDSADEYSGKTVLCVGARASGADIAREIGLVANKVYLSDSTCFEKKEFDTNVVLMPRTQLIDDKGRVYFSTGDDKQKEVATDIDVIIFCSGYDYSFPFINGQSNLDFQSTPGERRVAPLFEQLWHAKHPSLSFIGLPHSVVPFPMFEIQANAVRIASEQHYTGQTSILPSLSDRLKGAEQDAASGGPDNPGRVQDTHYLGSHQWDYCRKMAKIAGFYNQSTENYIATNKELYDCSGRERKAMIPGGEDMYRKTKFCRDDDNRSYRIVHSEMPATMSSNR